MDGHAAAEKEPARADNCHENCQNNKRFDDFFHEEGGEGRTVSASGRLRLKCPVGTIFRALPSALPGKRSQASGPLSGGRAPGTLFLTPVTRWTQRWQKERGRSEKNRQGVDVTVSLIHFSHRRAKAGIPAVSCAIPFLRLRSGKGRCAKRNSRTDPTTRGYPI